MLIKVFDILGKEIREKQQLGGGPGGRRRNSELIKRAKKYNKQNKGAWGMPRLSEAMKDAISCDKLRGSAHTM